MQVFDNCPFSRSCACQLVLMILALTNDVRTPHFEQHELQSLCSGNLWQVQALSNLAAEGQCATEYFKEVPGLTEKKSDEIIGGQPGSISWKWNILRPVLPGQ